MTSISPATPGHTTTPRRQAGRRPMFSADDVVDTAMRLGLGTFSIASVARELGVTTAAVYRRFPSHNALLNECITRILTEVPPLAGVTDWKDTLRVAADQWWALSRKHPELPQVVSGHEQNMSRFITAPFQSHGRLLISVGFTVHQAYFAASLLMSSLNLVSRLQEKGLTELTRERLKTQAVEIIISGIAEGTTGWNITGH